jgi:hypothetical protein
MYDFGCRQDYPSSMFDFSHIADGQRGGPRGAVSIYPVVFQAHVSFNY